MLHITIVNINLVGTNKQEMGLSIKWTYFLIGLDKIVMIEFKSILLSALNWNNVVWALYVSINSIQVKVGSGNNNVVNSSDLQPSPLGCLETNKLFSWWWDDDCGLVFVPRGFVMMSPAASATLMPASPATNDKVIPRSANNCWHETPSCSVTVTSSHRVPVSKTRAWQNNLAAREWHLNDWGPAGPGDNLRHVDNLSSVLHAARVISQLPRCNDNTQQVSSRAQSQQKLNTPATGGHWQPTL